MLSYSNQQKGIFYNFFFKRDIIGKWKCESFLKNRIKNGKIV